MQQPYQPPPKIRYSLTQPQVAQCRFHTPNRSPDIPQYNIHPGMNAPIVYAHRDGYNALAMGLFGFLPPWFPTSDRNSFLIARSETILEKGTFRDAFTSMRCLVVADGLFLWDEKQPYYVRLKSRQLFGIAGIFAVNYHYSSPLVSFALLTADSNSTTWHIHKRTCVIIRREDEAAYLNPATTLDDVMLMLEAYPENSMEVIKVSPRLTKATNNSPDFIQRYEEDVENPGKDLKELAGQRSLFD